MENLKIITTDIFLEKFDNHTLENEDLTAIYFQKHLKIQIILIGKK